MNSIRSLMTHCNWHTAASALEGRGRKSAFIVATLMLTTTTLGFLPHCHAASSSKWRTLSRQANIALSDNEFARAISEYQSAITVAEKTDQDDECKYDLYLNLAETYRRAKEYAQAKAVLDKLAPVILSGSWNDPLLPVRYWRRRADLLLSVGDAHGYADSQAKALAIFFQCMPEENRTPLAQQVSFVYQLLALKQWSACALAAQKLKTIRPMTPEESSNINRALMDVCQAFRAQEQQALAAKNWLMTVQYLDWLGQFDPSARDFSRWLDWSNANPNPDTACINLAINSLTRSLNRVDASGEATGCAALMLRLLLAKLYHLNNKPEQAALQVAAILKMPTCTDSSVIALQRQYCAFCFERGRARIGVGVGKSDSLTCQLLSEASQLNPASPPNASAKDRQQSLYLMALYRLNYARALNLDNQVNKAAQVMDSIPADVVRQQSEGFLYRYVRIGSRLARNQMLSGQGNAALKRYADLMVITAALKDRKQAAELEQFIRKCRQLDSPVSRLKAPIHVASRRAEGSMQSSLGKRG